jgi:hypothetical protein
MTSPSPRPTARALLFSLALLAAASGCAPAGDTGGQDAASGTGPGVAQGPAGGAAKTDPACQALEGLPQEQGELQKRLEKARISGADSGGFREPRGTDMAAFERAFTVLLSGSPTPEAVADLASLGFTTTRFRDSQGAGGDWLLVEGRKEDGGGTFAVNLAPARDLWIEAPHADSDEGTLAQGAEQAVALGARALLVTGSNRCAAAEATPCAGVTKMCGGELKVSDVAHFDRNFFTSAHRALRDRFRDAVAVQIHGMDAPGAEAAVLSNGTEETRPDGVSVRLRDALNSRLKGSRAYSCNDRGDDGKHRILCGTNNVQGSLDNGESDACNGRPTAASDRFLHLEQAESVRLGRNGPVMVDAMAEAFPCTLPGLGISCPAASAAPPRCG